MLNNLQLLLIFIFIRCAKFLGNCGFVQVGCKNVQVQERLGGGGEFFGVCEFGDQRDIGVFFDFFQDLCIFFLETENAGIKGGCGRTFSLGFTGTCGGSFCETERRFVPEGVFFYAEQDVQQGAADPGVSELSCFQEVTEGTPGGKIISLVDDAVGEIFADI